MDAFLRAALVPVDGGWHGAGTLEEAQAILTGHPELVTADIHTAAVLGDETAVRRMIARDPASATAKGGPYGWDPLTCLCFSRYLRLDRARSEALVRTAEALLDAGGDPNTGFFSDEHQPEPQFESVIYAAAGLARHPELTRLLLARGADPNDGETAYHAPETVDDRALRVVVESGKLAAEGITTLLHRKLDWHHLEGIAWLLEHGADPNRPNHHFRCSSALHHALGRCCGRRYFELLLDHGADPMLPAQYGPSPGALAARLGRADILDLFRQRGFSCTLAGDDAFLEACARGDEPLARQALAAEPGLVARLQAEDRALVAEFAGAGNTAGVRVLLGLGFDIGSRTGRGGASGDSALHVAVWREREDTVALLLERGAPLEALNDGGHTPLSLAVRAQVERSDWTPHESTAILARLLEAGARVETVALPSGSAEADALLRKFGKTG
jgi:hypothetical protein